MKRPGYHPQDACYDIEVYIFLSETISELQGSFTQNRHNLVVFFYRFFVLWGTKATVFIMYPDRRCRGFEVSYSRASDTLPHWTKKLQKFVSAQRR